MIHQETIQRMKLYLFDMDGTIYLGDELFDFTISLPQWEPTWEIDNLQSLLNMCYLQKQSTPFSLFHH